VFQDGPIHLPWILHFRVPNADYKVEDHRGGVEGISPEEAAH
jgi:hypothetical protein